jgi:hypothetical protein
MTIAIEVACACDNCCGLLTYRAGISAKWKTIESILRDKGWHTSPGSGCHYCSKECEAQHEASRHNL